MTASDNGEACRQSWRGLPAWVKISERVTIVLPRITQRQLEQADSMLRVWSVECRAKKDRELSDPTACMAESLGRLGEQGAVAMMARGHDSGLGPVAMACDRIIARLSRRKQRVLRLAYISFNFPMESAFRMRIDYPHGWNAEVWSARLSVAARLDDADTEYP